MHAPIRLRPFLASDLSTFAEAYDLTWGWELSPDEQRPERMRHAEIYVIGNLLKSDFVRVAQLPDGSPGALMCARLNWRTAPNPKEGEFEGLAEMHEALVGEQKKSALGRSCLEFEANLHKANSRMIADHAARTGGSREDRPELVFLIAHPNARRRGLAGMLLKLFEGKALEAGANEAVLYTDSDCITAIYERSGWRKTDEIPWRIEENEDFRSWLFVKTLEPVSAA